MIAMYLLAAAAPVEIVLGGTVKRNERVS